MNEKEDLMALAFMVGGEINNIKQASTDRSRFVAENLPNPKDFVLNVAKQDINAAIKSSQNQTIAIQNQISKEMSKNQTQTAVSNTNNDVLLQQIVNELKTTNDILKRFATKLGLL